MFKTALTVNNRYSLVQRKLELLLTQNVLQGFLVQIITGTIYVSQIISAGIICKECLTKKKVNHICAWYINELKRWDYKPKCLEENTSNAQVRTLYWKNEDRIKP